MRLFLLYFKAERMTKKAEENAREEAEVRLKEEHMKEEIEHGGKAKESKKAGEETNDTQQATTNEPLQFDMFADEAPIEVL
jgi:hypothetical protein